MKTLKQRSYNEWLVVRSQDGEADAFDELIRAWQPRLYRYALNRIRDKEAAHDVLQECLVSISKSLDKLSDPAAFPKWSFRIMEFRCVDWLRKTIREREVFSDSEANFEAIDSGFDQSSVDLQHSIQDVLKKIDVKLAQVLRLYYLESFSIDEIAEIITVPRGTVKSRLYYARKIVAQALED